MKPELNNERLCTVATMPGRRPVFARLRRIFGIAGRWVPVGCETFDETLAWAGRLERDGRLTARSVVVSRSKFRWVWS